MEIRGFDNADWHGFLGAENFADGHAPLICDDDPAFVAVASAVGVEVYLNSPDGEQRAFALHHAGLTWQMAMLLLRAIAPLMENNPTDAERARVLTDYGFGEE
jgi:hypothetical protein